MTGKHERPGLSWPGPVWRSRAQLRDSRLPIWVLLLALPCLLASCSRLPGYARPSARVMQQADYQTTDVIPYRELSRDDFRGASPPEHVAPHAAKLGAHTCGFIVPDSFELRATIVLDPESNGYVAPMPPLRFHAEMDRECSWWNPAAQRVDAAYILQHEQIHFAIFELEARRLSGDIAGLQGRGSSPEAAGVDMQRVLDAAVREAMSRVLVRSTRFDEETSFVHAPDRQARWAEEVRAELARGR